MQCLESLEGLEKDSGLTVGERAALFPEGCFPPAPRFVAG
jgi:hypothetical protein